MLTFKKFIDNLNQLQYTSDNKIQKEWFEMEFDYLFWGWIKPDGSLLLPTSKMKNDKNVLYTHLNLLGKIGNSNNDAFDNGMIRFFIDNKNTLYFQLPITCKENTIHQGYHNIENYLIKNQEKISTIFGSSSRFIGSSDVYIKNFVYELNIKKESIAGGVTWVSKYEGDSFKKLISQIRDYKLVDYNNSDAESNIIDKKSPEAAYEYAKNVIKGPWLKGEDIISTDPGISYAYAKNVIKGRWTKGEDEILNNYSWAIRYAKDVIEGRWSKLEKKIIKYPAFVYEYAKNVIEGRWTEGEDEILKDRSFSVLYAKDVIKGRWPKLENEILKLNNPIGVYAYAKDVIKGPWPEGEDAILKYAYTSYDYAKDVIKGPWTKGEDIISSDPGIAYEYAKNILKIKNPKSWASNFISQKKKN